MTQLDSDSEGREETKGADKISRKVSDIHDMLLPILGNGYRDMLAEAEAPLRYWASLDVVHMSRDKTSMKKVDAVMHESGCYKEVVLRVAHKLMCRVTDTMIAYVQFFGNIGNIKKLHKSCIVPKAFYDAYVDDNELHHKKWGFVNLHATRDETTLHFWVKHGFVDAVIHLMYNRYTCDFRTIMDDAIQSGSIDIIRIVMNTLPGAGICGAGTVAAGLGNMECLKMLHEAGKLHISSNVKYWGRLISAKHKRFFHSPDTELCIALQQHRQCFEYLLENAKPTVNTGAYQYIVEVLLSLASVPAITLFIDRFGIRNIQFSIIANFIRSVEMYRYITEKAGLRVSIDYPHFIPANSAILEYMWDRVDDPEFKIHPDMLDRIVLEGRHECVSFLLGKGAIILNSSHIVMAVQSGSALLIEELLRNEVPMHPDALFESIQHDHVHITKLLLHYGWTSSEGGKHGKCLQALLDFGV